MAQILHGCGVGQKLIQLLAWEPPCAAGAALEKTKKKKKDFQGTKNMQIDVHRYSFISALEDEVEHISQKVGKH